jgi:hypothetical protein
METKLIHGLSTRDILVNPQNFRLTGLLDFDVLQISTPLWIIAPTKTEKRKL